MGSISRSAQVRVSFVDMPSTALANTSGIVARHLLATLITGWVTAHVPSYPTNFAHGYGGEVDNRLSERVCQARRRTHLPSDHHGFWHDGAQF
jgi:hypothetical protein